MLSIVGDRSFSGFDVEEFVAANFYRSDGKYKCRLCDYAHATNIKTHVENKHLPKFAREISCSMCGHICPSKTALKAHMKNKH